MLGSVRGERGWGLLDVFLLVPISDLNVSTVRLQFLLFHLGGEGRGGEGREGRGGEGGEGRGGEGRGGEKGGEGRREGRGGEGRREGGSYL